MDDTPPPPADLRRVLVVGGLSVLLLVGLAVLVRPLIFFVAPERGDTNMVVAAVADASDRPLLVRLLLREGHGLHGEEVVGEHVAISVVVAPGLVGGFSVVNAWSPVHECAIGLGADRLIDCAGATWTYAGLPIDPAHPSLQRFAVQAIEGALVVDFTAPLPAGSG